MLPLLGRVRRLAYGRPTTITGLWPAMLALVVLGLGLGGLLHNAQATQRAHSSLTRTRNAATHKDTPDNAPRTARPALVASDDALQLLMQRQLQADDLLPDVDNYSIALTTKQLLVNGQPQLADLLPRYQQFYEAATGWLMTPTTSYKTHNRVTYAVKYTSTRPESAALMRQLLRDGLLADTVRRFQVTQTTDGALLFNGQPQSATRRAAYWSLLPLPSTPPGSATTLTMSLSPGETHWTTTQD